MHLKVIRDKIGTFVKMENSGVMGIDKSIRIQMSHDVRKPLASHFRVKMKGAVEENFEVNCEWPRLSVSSVERWAWD